MPWNTGLVTAFHANPDGKTSDAPLMPGLISQLNEDADQRERLFIEDRQLRDLVQPAQITARPGDQFLIRCSHKVSYFREKKSKLGRGVDAAGCYCFKEWGWIGKPEDPRRMSPVRTLRCSA